jgi:hypothetical protein
VRPFANAKAVLPEENIECEYSIRISCLGSVRVALLLSETAGVAEALYASGARKWSKSSVNIIANPGV